MTGQDIIDEVRITLMDTTESYRWADALLLGFLNDALNALFSRRPDCVILDGDEAINLDRPVALVDLDETLVLEDRWRQTLVHYVLWRTYDTDGDQHEEGSKGKALGYKARYEEDARVT